MAKQFDRIDEAHREFIANQKIFFNASAAFEGRVNLSPRDGKSLRLIDDRTVVYLDLTGSGNETAAHLRANGRLTLMFCAFEGAPMILRLYGTGRVLGRGSAEYAAILARQFNNEEPLGARQMIMLAVDLVLTSCGYNVPKFDYRGERDTLIRWTEKKGVEGLESYWREKNLRSIDGLHTGLMDEQKPAECGA
jgi:predicted pyridoxine 5'-phosphate oxidase superfamily flavin-nucleotide-binding protein